MEPPKKRKLDFDTAGASSWIKNTLSCTRCKEWLTLPVYQCSSLHAFCYICKLTLNKKCSDCGEKLKDSDVLETLLSQAKFEVQCRFFRCQTRVNLCDLTAHALYCNYRDISCDVDGMCLNYSERIPVEEIGGHLNLYHDVDVFQPSAVVFKGVPFVLTLHKNDSNTWPIKVLSYDDKTILLRIRRIEDYFRFWLVSLIPESVRKETKYDMKVVLTSPSNTEGKIEASYWGLKVNDVQGFCFNNYHISSASVFVKPLKNQTEICMELQITLDGLMND